MSISITTNGYSNYVVQNQTANKVQNLQSNNNILGVNSDSLIISAEALANLSSTTNTTILPSGNYTNTIRTEPLTTEEMSSYLSRMIERLSTTNLECEESKSASKRASTISTLKETLAGVDLTSATDEEIESLFTNVTNIFKESRPPREPHGLPPIEIMEGVTSTLSNEENSHLLSTILNHLTFSEDNAESTLLKLQEALTGVDVSTDEDVESVFNIVMEVLDENLLVEHQAAISTIFESAADLTTEEKKSFLMEIINSFQLSEEETNTVLSV